MRNITATVYGAFMANRLRAFADITTKQGRVFVNGQEVNSYEWITV